MRLLFGRPVRVEGRQPEHLTAPAVHLPTLSVSQRDQLDGDHAKQDRRAQGSVARFWQYRLTVSSLAHAN